MYCYFCEEQLVTVPIYNNGEDDKFPPYFLMCANPECPRVGLLASMFISEKKLKEKKDEKPEDKKN